MGAPSHQPRWPDVRNTTGQTVPRPGRRLGCWAPSAPAQNGTPRTPSSLPPRHPARPANLPAPPPPRLPPGSATSPCAPRWPFRMTIQTKPGLPLCPAPNVQSPFPSDKIKTPDPRRAPRGSEGLPAARTSRGAHPRPRPPPRVAGARPPLLSPPRPPHPWAPPHAPCPVPARRSRRHVLRPGPRPGEDPGLSDETPRLLLLKPRGHHRPPLAAGRCTAVTLPTREAKRRGLTNAGPSDRRRLGSPEHEGRGVRRGRTSSQIPAQRLLRAGGVSMGTDGHGVSFWGDENVLKWDRVLYTGDLYGP